MRIRILLFAAAREAVGRGAVEIAVADEATVGELREALAVRYPALAPIISTVRLAVDRAYVDDRTVLVSGAEVAVIPLVSGG